MSSPGGMEVDRVSVRVVPDTSKLPGELRREIKQAIKGLKIEIPVKAVVEGLREEVKKVEAEAAKAKAKIDVEVDGDGAVRETRRVRQFIQKTLGSIKTTLSLNLPASIAIIRTQMALIQKSVQGYNIRIPMEIVGISKWLAILATVSGILLTIPHLIGAIGGAVATVGGAFALLPALAAAATASIAALVVGMKGFFSALSQAGDAAAFEEALAKLTPNAQAAARALATWREPLGEIRKSVQEKLFEGMAGQFDQLKSLLPPIKTGLTGIAGGLNGMIRRWIDMASSAESVADTSTILGNIQKALENARNALANFGRGLKDIAVVGSSFLPGFGKSIDDVSKRFADWARSARESGKMKEWIQNALDNLKQMGRIVADVWVGFQNIFDALRGGEDFLDILERMSQGFRDLTETDDFKSALQSLARVMRVVIDAATELFGQVFRTAGDVFKELEPFLITFAQTFATVVADALRAITPLLKDIARWLSENKEIMVPLAITIVALVTAFKTLSTAANAVNALGKSINALKDAGELIGGPMAKTGEALKKIGTSAWEAANNVAGAVAAKTAKWREAAAQAILNAGKVSKAWVKSAATSAKEAVAKWAGMAADAAKQWGRMALDATKNAVKIAVTWIAQTARMIATTLAQMAVAAAAWAAHWARMAAAALLNAGRIALAWLIAMGPIALIIAAIVALVALIVLNWDNIKKATKAAWDWVWGHIKRIWAEISASFQAGVDFVRGIWDGLWKFVSDLITAVRDIVMGAVDKIIGFLRGIGNVVGDVIGFFEDIKNGIVEWFGKAVDWVKGIPQKILDALGDLGSLLWETGRDMVQGLWNGWKSYFDDFEQAVINDGNTLVDNINGIFEIFSPSRVFRQIGEYLGMGLIIGMESQRKQVFAAGDNMAYAVLDGFGNPKIEMDLASGIKDATPDALKAASDLAKKVTTSAQGEFAGQLGIDGNMASFADQIATAMNGVEVQMDSRRVGTILKKRDTQDKRRG